MTLLTGGFESRARSDGPDLSVGVRAMAAELAETETKTGAGSGHGSGINDRPVSPGFHTTSAHFLSDSANRV